MSYQKLLDAAEENVAFHKKAIEFLRTMRPMIDRLHEVSGVIKVDMDWGPPLDKNPWHLHVQCDRTALTELRRVIGPVALRYKGADDETTISVSVKAKLYPVVIRYKRPFTGNGKCRIVKEDRTYTNVSLVCDR